MTILIAGGSGLVGRCMSQFLINEGVNFVTTYNSRNIENGYTLNYYSMADIENFMIDHKITVCINCIVQRETDICEKDWNETKRVNIDIVDNLARVCKKLDIHIVHISTDYIFDGYNAPYKPEDNANPLQNYGISKLIAEKRIIVNCNKYTIIRVPVLYCDDIESLQENAVTLIGKKVLNQIEEAVEDDYSIRRPVYIPDFCKFIYYIIIENKEGVYHYYNPNDIVTKYDMLQIIGKYLNKSTTHIFPSKPHACNLANRPYDTQLIDNKYNIDSFPVLNITEGIHKCFSKWMHPLINNSNSKDIIIFSDLDGTLIDTDRMHFESYKYALNKYNINLSWSKFEEIINIYSIDKYILDCGCTKEDLKNIKLIKNEQMLTHTCINYMPGAEEFILKCIDNNINFVIVTNTSRETVRHFQRYLPTLSKISKIICKEDYSTPKPSSECYQTAYNTYYNNEKYIIGLENTINGYQSIKNIARCIYINTAIKSYNYKYMKDKDVYLINNLSQI